MTNRLAAALSPYLLAHADNPVDWYPWGTEAFAEAQRRDVPLLISLGYSTCHWCHVMARESFSDPVTAAAINEGFVAVKVDREEHPDVDGAYLAAASAFTQNLGWPLTVFATPQGKAFYAGTYWPPEARGPLPGFREVLAAVREAWTSQREQVIDSSEAVAGALAEAARVTPSALPSAALLGSAGTLIVRREDTRFGGFGEGAKFPVAPTLRFLQSPLVRREAPEAAAAAERTLRIMAASPLRDLDGGFFRYATRQDWTVPHYERMLTDNAQLIDVAVDAGDAVTARGVASFLRDVLRREGGGFGAAQDSESWIDGRRSEGGYYLHGAEGRAALVAPAVDDKVITGWNGLAIGALSRAGARLGEPEWIAEAGEAARVVLSANRDRDGRLMRASVGGVAAEAVATAADAGLLAEGLFALALATGEAEWAIAARTLLTEALAPEDSSDAAGIDPRHRGAGVDPVLTAQGIPLSPEESDGDLPSGTSALAGAALSAWRLGAGEPFRDAAESLVRTRIAAALGEPFAQSALLRVAAGLIDPPRQLVVVTEDPQGALARAAAGADADVLAVVSPAQAAAFAAAGFSLLTGKDAVAERAYDCRAFVCRLPVADAAEMRAGR